MIHNPITTSIGRLTRNSKVQLISTSKVGIDLEMFPTGPMIQYIRQNAPYVNMPLVTYNLDDMVQPMPINGLNSVLANAAPETRKVILSEYLYPLVNQIENENAVKVTKMILKMDVAEVLFLLESPDDLKAKVTEAMEVIRNVKQQELKDLKLD